MFWLEVLLNTLGNLLYDLIFPQPVGDATLPPPAYVPPPDVVLPPEGGQCPVRYNVTITQLRYGVTGALVSVNTLVHPNVQGPLLEFTTEETTPLGHHFNVKTPLGFRTLWGVGPFPPDYSIQLSRYEVRYFQRSGNSVTLVERFVYKVDSIVRVDGLPDDCGSIPPPSEVRERLIPVNRPVPIPVPFPPIVTPPVPLPVPIPPAPPLPRNLPRPPRPVRPPSDINLDIDLNFDFSTTINFNFNIDCEAKTGTLPTAPFQALAKLLYAVLFEVRELREVVDRMAKQVDCLAEKFCRESKGIYCLPLGEIGYSKRSFYGFATSINEKFTPVGIQILLPQIQSGAGRRVRKFAPNLYSEQALGYYAFQFESGGFGELGELRFSQCYIPIPERAIAIAFWLEPQAGEGLVYCWYDKTEYAE